MSDDGDDRDKLVVLDPSRVVKRAPTGRLRAPKVNYSRELAEEIAEVVALSNYGIGRLCAAHPHWPAEASIFRWEQKHEEFRALMAIAMQYRAERIVRELIEIADDDSSDLMQIGDQTVPNPAAVARSKVRAEVRLKLLPKLHPQKYGDKLDISAALGYVSQEDAIRQLK